MKGEAVGMSEYAYLMLSPSHLSVQHIALPSCKAGLWLEPFCCCRATGVPLCKGLLLPNALVQGPAVVR